MLPDPQHDPSDRQRSSEPPSPPPSPTPRHRGPFSGTAGVGTERIEAFSDGVYAIAITLLVLNFAIATDLADDQVWPAITDQAPQLLSAALSFAVIGVYWAGHNTLFRRIEQCSGSLTVVNLLHLATIVFLPFPTLVLAEYSDSFAGVSFYAATLALTGFSAALVTWTAWRQGLMASSVDRQWIEARLIGLCSTPMVFVLSIAVASVNPTAATYFWLFALVADRVMTKLVSLIGR